MSYFADTYRLWEELQRECWRQRELIEAILWPDDTTTHIAECYQ